MTAELTPDDLARMRVWLEGVADELRVNPNDAFTPDAMAALSADAVRLLDEVERLRGEMPIPWSANIPAPWRRGAPDD